MNFDIQLLYHKKIMYLKMLLIQLDPVLSGNSICEEILVYPLLVTFSRFIHFHGKNYQRYLCMLCVTGLQDKMADHNNVREGLGTKPKKCRAQIPHVHIQNRGLETIVTSSRKD